MGWSNLLKNPLGSLSGVAISAPASDWSGSGCRGKEGPSSRHIESLLSRPLSPRLDSPLGFPKCRSLSSELICVLRRGDSPHGSKVTSLEAAAAVAKWKSGVNQCTVGEN